LTRHSTEAVAAGLSFRVTCIIDGARVPDAVRALHAAFELETPSEEDLAGTPTGA
jgi:hypothetical protein